MLRQIAIALCIPALAGCGRNRTSLHAEPNAINLTADGFSAATVRVDAPDASAEIIEGARRIRVESAVNEGGHTEILLRSGVLGGTATIEARASGRNPVRILVKLAPDTSDRDRDGTPDVLLLTDEADRAAFVEWFTFLAEARYGAKPSAEIADCAALLRFAYREALREHDSEQAGSLALPALPASGGVRKYQYPYTPFGAKLFRTPSGFAEFADAETLMTLNTWPVSRDISRARPGDLLFYKQLEQSMPFHAMVYVGLSRIEPNLGEVVVYHTGPIAKEPGEVRRLNVRELLDHPSPRWRPLPGNTNFMGIFRWNILKDSQ